MTAYIAAYGRLGGDPGEISTQSGKPMAVASIALDVADSREEDAPPLWLGIVAFGALAERLLGHGQGEPLSASGRLQRRAYTDRNGEAREQWQVVADSLVSARTVRPGQRKSQRSANASSAADAPTERVTEPDPDDDLPF